MGQVGSGHGVGNDVEDAIVPLRVVFGIALEMIWGLVLRDSEMRP